MSMCLGIKVGIVFLAALVSARSSVVHEKRDGGLPVGWERTRRLHPNVILPVSIGMKQENLHNLEKMVMDVASPQSPNFSKHWSATDIIETFAPSSDSIDVVRAWLEEAGFASERLRLSKNRGWFQVNMTVDEAEHLFDTEYHLHTHTSGKTHIACDSYVVPSDVQPHIDIVLPSIAFAANVKPQIHKRELNSLETRDSHKQPGFTGPKTSVTVVTTIYNGTDHCAEQTTISCIKALYNINYTSVRSEQNSLGVVEYTPGSYLSTDLDMFFEQFASPLVGHRPVMNSIDGGVLSTNSSIDFNAESDLDLEYAMALVYPLTPVLYQTGDNVEGASFNNFLDAIDASYCTFEGGDDPTQDGTYPDSLPGGYNGTENCGGFQATNVISISYGYNEADLTPFYEERQCAEYAKLALRGVTVLYSSGDYGVAGNTGECLNPDGSQTLNGTIFNPSFPSTCPYVTSVGATQIKPNGTVFEPEEACETKVYSGGGFSNRFGRPGYQATAVDSYLENHHPNYTGDQYNTSYSRAYPDISAIGANYVTAIDGEFILVWGTSASAPVFGSMITLINDARLAMGKKPVGFLNPTLYSLEFAGAFNDITTGGNQGCGTPGFTAVPGWDPVTGLGTPNFENLKNLYLKLP